MEPYRMWRLFHVWYKLNRGPHRNAVVGAFLASALVLALLSVEVIREPSRAPTAIAVAAILLALDVAVALLNLLRAKLNDVHHAISLEAGLRRAGYEPADLFTDGAAASPSLQLFHLKVLRFCRPRRVLELGSGQTTKLLSCYAREDPSAYVLTLEQDEGWMERLGPHVAHHYLHVPLEPVEFTCKGTDLRLATRWYQDRPELRDAPFDYILIDGPDPGTRGTEHTDYSRCGILRLMPDILAPSFVVVFDDAERYGEIMTIDALAAILDACRVPYLRFSIHGIKSQTVFCSPDRSFLQAI
jgi:hypothetical protein